MKKIVLTPKEVKRLLGEEREDGDVKTEMELRLEEERLVLESCLTEATKERDELEDHLLEATSERDELMNRALSAEAKFGRKRRAVRSFVSESTARVRKLASTVTRSLRDVGAALPKRAAPTTEAVVATREQSESSREQNESLGRSWASTWTGAWARTGRDGSENS